MDVTSALRGDAFRPFATLVAPGALGVTPFAVLLYEHAGAAQQFWDLHPIASGVGLFIGSLTAGLVFENIGARVEEFIDKRLSKIDADHLPTWRQYLMLVLNPEPIGQRYLRTIVFRLKFELGILGSLIAQFAGWMLVLRAQGAPFWSFATTIAALAIVAAWFYCEAFDSAKTLGLLRKDLVAQFGAAQQVHVADERQTSVQ